MGRLRHALAATCLALVACAEDPAPGFETPVDLPESAHGRAVSTEGWLTIHLTREGELVCEGRVRTLEELSGIVARVARESEAEPRSLLFPPGWRALPILIRADCAAPYLHIAWLRAIAAGARFAVVTKGQEAVLEMPDTTDFWSHWLGTVGAAGSEDTIPVIHRPLGVTTDEIRAARAALARKYSSPAVGIVDVPTRTPFAEVVAAIDRFRAAGVNLLELPDELPHPWVRRQRRLPRPRVPRLLDSSDSGFQAIDVALPLARAATPCDGRYNRLVELTAQGEVVYRGKLMNLNELGAVLHRAAEAHAFRLRQRGESGFEGTGPRYSTLSVLVRADRAAPWEHVRLLLTIMAEQRVRRVRLGALAQADLSCSPAEAKRHGVARDRIPRPAGVDEAELYVPMPIAAVDGPELAVDGSTYTLGERTTSDLRELGEWLRAAAPGAARVRATPRTPWQNVVAAVSRLKEAGCETIGFDTGPRPDADLRRLKQLPIR